MYVSILHPIYRDIFLGRAQACIGAAKAVSHFSHAGLKGQLREIVVKELLRPLLPPDTGIGTGQVISAYGETSRQEDLVLYKRSLLPAVVFEGECGAFPLESVLVTIEVKSRLTAGDLKAADIAARELSRFRYAPAVGSAGCAPEHPIEGIISYLLAFDSDLEINSLQEAERYDRNRDLSAPPGILGLCVAGRGFWFWSDSAWNQWFEDAPGAEVVNMIVAIMNTYARVSSTRRQPDLRIYVLPE